MQRLFHLFLVGVIAASLATAQTQDKSTASDNNQNSANSDSNQNSTRKITIPAGTKVLLHLKSPINTKSARVGDDVYCETAFPVTQDNVMVIPPRTFVKGKLMRVQRPGRVSGRAELQVHFTTLIFPDGYTIDLPGSLENTPGAEHHSMSGEEGTVKADGQKAKDAGTVATTSAIGAGIGGLATGTLKGAAIGGGIGGVVGLATVLLTRGQDIRLDTGTAMEMILQRPLTLDPGHAAASRNYY
jgi:type IV secretion system protein VirB10